MNRTENDEREVLSFKKVYLKDYGDEYLSYIKKEIEEGKLREYISGKHIKSPEKFIVENSSIRNVCFYRKSSTEIYADVTVSVCVGISETIGGDTYKDIFTGRFVIRTYSCLEVGHRSMNNLVAIYPYSESVPAPGIILNECLVPYMGGPTLEDEARAVLEEYYPEALKGEEMTDGEKLAARMSLNVIYSSLSEDRSIIGQYFFENGYVSYLFNGKKVKKKIPSKSIVIDLSTCMDADGVILTERQNRALIHECIHASKHELFYLGQKYSEKSIKSLNLTSGHMEDVENGKESSLYPEEFLVDEGTERLSDKRTVIDWVEWQTDRLTPRTYMPEDVIRAKTEELKEKFRRKYKWVSDEYIIKKVIVSLADEYGVSVLYAKNRLSELGYTEARGVFEFLEKGYVPPVLVRERSLSSNQTYTVSFSDLIRIYNENSDFKALIDTGDYVYTDGHLVKNEPKYLLTRGSSHTLTSYAKKNMSECAVIFTYQGNIVGRKSYSGRLSKRTFSSPAKLTYIKAADVNFKKEADRLSSILYSLPASPSLTLCSHMKRKRITIESLAEKSGVSDRTISRLRTDDMYRPSLSNAIAVCIGLELEPKLSGDLLKKMGIVFSERPDDLMYELMLNTMYRSPISEVNCKLIEYGYPPLSKQSD